jgi:tRNA(fMet)-specific endonuclease VapC
VYTSAITLAELTYGATRSARPAYHVSRARELTKHISVLPVDSRVANEYGFLKSKLASVGQLLEDNDLFIASTAISRNLILVTHDKGFSRIQGLELEDWL